MTAARPPRKLNILPLRRASAAVVLVGLWHALSPSAAAGAEYIVVDAHTGLAIDGFDPVAFFTDNAPLLGRGAFELKLAGVVWRFSNEGNRAAFAAHPEIYRPQFGGYDPVGIARGVGVAGNPLYWLVSGERLYLFYDQKARAAFQADEKLLATADSNWPSVQLTLAP